LEQITLPGLRGVAARLVPAAEIRDYPRTRFLLTRFLKRSQTEPAGITRLPEPLPTAPAVIPTRTGAAPRIHPLAVVDPQARLGEDCEVGPFCLVGPDVVMGPGNKLDSHVVINGHTTIGADNQFFPNAVIGALPQDKKFHGEQSYLVIGDRNVIRESVTMHLGTAGGGLYTRVGNDNLLMVNCHIGHDCQVGSFCILGNNVMLAGHTVIEDRVNISGGVGTQSFSTIGQHAYIAAMARIHHDVPPFMKVSDDDKVRDVNAEGLRRAGIAASDIDEIEKAARQLFFARKNKKPFATVMSAFEADADTNPRVRQLVAFLRRRDAGKSGRYLESLRVKK
jgi:UDP-N-acetylglucosamine acyltransferase